MVRSVNEVTGVMAPPLGCSCGCSGWDWQGGEYQLGLAVWDPAGAKGRDSRSRHV